MPTVLVVDDSPVDRQLIEQTLAKDALWAARFAESGENALDEIESSEPDVVVTDLVMPQMSGLELIAEIRDRFPHLPGILLTGQGSDDLQEQALREGAASYVSKAHFQEDLVPTIEEVHALVRKRPQRDALARGMKEAAFTFRLDNNLEVVSRLVDFVLPTMHAMRIFDRTDRRNVTGALTEAIVNAILHGNLALSPADATAARNAFREMEPCTAMDTRLKDPQFGKRHVHLRIELSQTDVRFCVRDEGNGFDHATITPLSSDGRGLTLMRTHMDEVTFNDAGNEVTLIKRHIAVRS